MYSRLTYAALKVEVTENTMLKPDTFFPIVSQDIVTQYSANASMPIIGNRTERINPIKNLIEAPSGSIGLQLEPKTLGHFLRAIYGAVTTGRYWSISGASGTFVAGETITASTSGATAVISAISAEADYILSGAITGTPVAGQTITGGTSGATATIVAVSSSVYGHEFKAPQSSLPTYTLEIGYDDMAYRFGGVRFNAFNPVSQNDNIMTAEVMVMARSEFKHARVTAAVTAGAGAKTIPLDQTTGLTTSDTIKVFRPSTGAFLDFVSAGVKTHAPATIPGETSITVTNLETALAVGDLVVLAPQTPSYTLGKEFSWIGGSVVRAASTMAAAVAASAASIEAYTLQIMNELEARHAANGTNLVNRFPSKNHLKKFTGEGTVKKAYLDQTFLDRMRNNTQTAWQFVHTGDQISATGIYYTLDLRVPFSVLRPHSPSFEQDALLDEEMEFDIYRDSTAGYSAKALLVNEITAY